MLVLSMTGLDEGFPDYQNPGYKEKVDILDE
jgi:hypothetical protein